MSGKLDEDRAAVLHYLNETGAVGKIACPASFLREVLVLVNNQTEHIRRLQFELGRAHAEIGYLGANAGKNVRFEGYTMLQLADLLRTTIHTTACKCVQVRDRLTLAPEAKCRRCQDIIAMQEEFNVRQERGIAAAIERNRRIIGADKETPSAYHEGALKALSDLHRRATEPKYSLAGGGPGTAILEPKPGESLEF